MLRLTGKCLEVTTDTITGGPNGSFISTTIHVMTTTPQGPRIEAVRTGAQFPPADLPRKDEDVELDVVVSAWAGKNGAAYRLTALARVKPSGSRIAAAS